jgi:hypothetical protein
MAGEAPKEGQAQPEPVKESTTESFTKEQVDAAIENALKDQRDQTQKIVDQLKAAKVKVDMTTEERKELEAQIDELQGKIMTKEELTAREAEQAQREHEKAVKELTEARDLWQGRFTDAAIIRAISDASAANEAYNSQQIVALLQPSTALVEENGALTPRVKLGDTDKEGKPVTLDLSVSEAVKRLSEKPEYMNLFKNTNPGGLGMNNQGKPKGEADIKSMSMDDYAKGRKEGTIKLPS